MLANALQPNTARGSKKDVTRQGLHFANHKGALFMILLALQFGFQPLLQKACVDATVDRISLVVAIEATKICLCCFVILASGPKTCRSIVDSWTLRGSLAAAALPAAAYALQNWLCQLAYMNLDSLTYNLLNQTKTLFAALSLYVVMGKKQSALQLLALSLLLVAALILNANASGSGESGSAIKSIAGGASGAGGGETAAVAEEGGGEEDAAAAAYARLWLGVIPVLGASFLSGLSGAVSQRTLQQSNRNVSQLSLELSVYTLTTLLLTSACSFGGPGGGGAIWRQELFRGWTRWTWVPVLSQAAGGLVVGQVTKHAGTVRKGFALIGGILMTAAVQSTLEESVLTMTHWTAAVLVAGGTFLHASYPYRAPKKIAKKL